MGNNTLSSGSPKWQISKMRISGSNATFRRNLGIRFLLGSDPATIDTEELATGFFCRVRVDGDVVVGFDKTVFVCFSGFVSIRGMLDSAAVGGMVVAASDIARRFLIAPGEELGEVRWG